MFADFIGLQYINAFQNVIGMYFFAFRSTFTTVHIYAASKLCDFDSLGDFIAACFFATSLTKIKS